MSNLDELYKNMQQAKEQQQRKNFDTFFTSLYEGLEKDLNKAYKEYSGDGEYLNMLNRIKSKGFKVMRNTEGNHKVEAR